MSLSPKAGPKPHTSIWVKALLAFVVLIALGEVINDIDSQNQAKARSRAQEARRALIAKWQSGPHKGPVWQASIACVTRRDWSVSQCQQFLKWETDEPSITSCRPDAGVRKMYPTRAALENFLRGCRQVAHDERQRVRRERKAVEIWKRYPLWPFDDYLDLARREIHEGMTSAEVRYAWGRPESASWLETAKGRVDVWLYHDAMVGFAGGQVVEIEETH